MKKPADPKYDPRTEEAAQSFFIALCEKTGLSERWNNLGWGRGKIQSLVWSAFCLYSIEWNGYDVREWKYPETTLLEGGSFRQDEPWSVLLTRAVELATEKAKESK